MICDCPSCGAALMFDPVTGKMKCNSCDNTYETFELHESYQEKIRREEAARNQQMKDHIEAKDTASATLSPDEMMECTIYSCTACGAEIAVNDVEASTFCAYCGQPTVVFNRIASTKKPKYIIPFSVSRDDAVSAIRCHLARGFFIPDEIKNFKIERVRGIYIPYWLCDVHYSDKQYLEGTVGWGQYKETYYYYREAECDFHNLTLDGSIQLIDETSQRLEPYYTNHLKEFSIEYLSGFYSDCYDTNLSDIATLATSRARNLFNDAMIRTVDTRDVSILDSHPASEITKTEYAMFPAWFLTFRYEDTPYTILVNGQTEKVVGAVPYEKKKALLFGVISSVIISILPSVLLIQFGSLMKDYGSAGYVNMLRLVFAILLYIFLFLSKSHSIFRKLQNSTNLTRLKETDHFVKDRQEGN